MIIYLIMLLKICINLAVKVLYSPNNKGFMKRCLLILVILIVFAACDQVIFPEPQPPKAKLLTEIPQLLQGIYIDLNGDSLIIYRDHYTYTSDDLFTMGDVYLSDTNVLKVFKEHYYYNTVVNLDSGRFWLTYMISLQDNNKGFDLLTMDPDDIVKLAKLQNITSKVMDIKEGESEYYLFDPKRKHYKKIISDSVFTKIGSFRRIK